MSEMSVEIPAGIGSLQGDLAVPPDAGAVVLFAHGSGSSRDSPRNRQVARRLQDDAIATLLLDLLSSSEEALELGGGQMRFDIDLLAERLLVATGWIRSEGAVEHLPLGYFGASTGAAAALLASTSDDAQVGAIVSRGGRPDLAGEALEAVKVPTLLIVGSRDPAVLELNERAAEVMPAEHRLEVIDGATHLFEEPGALEQVADLAAGWFSDHLLRR